MDSDLWIPLAEEVAQVKNTITQVNINKNINQNHKKWEEQETKVRAIYKYENQMCQKM